MAVNQIRLKLYGRTEGQRSPTQKDEALAIIKVIAFRSSVKIASVVEFISSDEVDVYGLVYLTTIDFRPDYPSVYGHG